MRHPTPLPIATLARNLQSPAAAGILLRSEGDSIVPGDSSRGGFANFLMGFYFVPNFPTPFGQSPHFRVQN